MTYVQRRPLVNAREYVVDEVPDAAPAFRRSGLHPGTSVSIFLFVLLMIWVLMSNNRSFRDFGINWGSDTATAERVSDREIAPIEPTPRANNTGTITGRPTSRRTVEPRPAVIAEATKATPRSKNSRIVGYSWILPEKVNMRTGPGTEYGVVSVLSEKQMVAVIDAVELDTEGEVWSKISVESTRGVQNGWVNRKYLSY